MAEMLYYGKLREVLGTSGESADAETVDGLLAFIGQKYGKAALREARRMLITVNGTGIQLTGRYKTPVSEGDTVAFLPLGAGG